jgi:hypothetical protein
MESTQDQRSPFDASPRSLPGGGGTFECKYSLYGCRHKSFKKKDGQCIVNHQKLCAQRYGIHGRNMRCGPSSVLEVTDGVVPVQLQIHSQPSLVPPLTVIDEKHAMEIDDACSEVPPSFSVFRSESISSCSFHQADFKTAVFDTITKQRQLLEQCRLRHYELVRHHSATTTQIDLKYEPAKASLRRLLGV